MTYRVGIAGSGFGERVHLPSFVAHPAFEVVAIASPHSAQRIAKERNIAAFKDVSEMLGGIDLDVVSVATPPYTHHDDVLAALAAKKHVLCEKPFALSVKEAQAMVEAAGRAGTACGVNHEFRWIPQRIALKELIQNNHLSALREIEITQLMRFLRAEGDRTRNWWFERSKGGGITGALLSHIIDSATWLAGRYPISSTGIIRTANPNRHDKTKSFTSDVDDGGFALVDYGDGLIARLTVDGTTAIESFTLAVHSENRTAVASGTDMADMRLFAVDEEETSELECALSKYAKFSSVNVHVPFMLELLDEFEKQIETGKSALPTFEDALHTQRVLESIGFTA